MSIEQQPDSTDTVRGSIPHSGVHHDEAPVRESDVPLSEEVLVTPDSPAQLDNRSFFQRHKRAIAGVAAANTLLGVATFMGVKKAFTDPIEEALNNPNPGNSAPANPGETAEPPELEPGGELSPAEQREAMYYAVESDYFIDEAWYDQVGSSSGDGPVGATDVTPYVNQEVLNDVVNDHLNNLTVATETGSNDAIIAAYGQIAPGEFGDVQDEVEQIRAQSEAIKDFSEQNPDYPVSSIVLQSIDSVSPSTTNKDEVTITYTVLKTTYGNYTPGQDIVEFKMLESWTETFQRQDVEGWSDAPADQYTATWVSTSFSLNSSEVQS
ncbi:MAG TPA: hypothetical protein PK096_01390 [Candidatus Saccharibacteria bacterium]|nr:hypothetical protein [Candidatus Saccharibacteria bacterium]HRK94003.1 hypothetical protein [Candidatus Saccharibacteria bacterium]